MAQTKKQRFRAERRIKKAPATKAPASKTSASAPKESGGKLKWIIGGAALALAGVATTVVLVANPFAAPAVTAAPSTFQSPSPVAALPKPTKLTVSSARGMLIREYRIAVDPETAKKVADSCQTGKPVSVSGRLKGVETNFDVTCLGVNLKVINSTTKAEIAPVGR